MNFDLSSVISLVTGDTAGVWVSAVTGVIAAATAVTALTPTKTDDKALNIVLRVLNWLAGNVYKNRNADDA